MIKQNVNSNAQSWELEIVCKNKQYLERIVLALLEASNINFEVERTCNDRLEDIWTIFMWSSWFDNLSFIANKLDKIEEELEG
jgi:hypothetical protein